MLSTSSVIAIANTPSLKAPSGPRVAHGADHARGRGRRLRRRFGVTGIYLEDDSDLAWRLRHPRW